MNPLLPKILESLPPDHPDLQEAELKALKTLEQADIPVAPLLVVPATLEEHFYHLNNLPVQLSKLFGKINLKRPDEDEVEDLAKEAQGLIKKHYFLDEIIDMLYTTMQPLPEKLVVRRAGQNGIQALKGRPVIMALKEVWSKDWMFETLLERLEKTHSIALKEKPVIIQSAGGVASENYSQQVHQILGWGQVEANPEGITRIL